MDFPLVVWVVASNGLQFLHPHARDHAKIGVFHSNTTLQGNN